MNYIIWKNQDSRNIKGLIISELPPISKPRMRTKETKIDGVDGSIIEELGYEPYDKSINIGLAKDYDIDAVIKYFSGTGNVIFSNESDKYYKATITDQIDYARLLRYRTASVKFKVQPFKYKSNEASVTLTKSGNVVNSGLETSKPKITITGSGTIELIVNGLTLFSYTFPDGETEVVIDSEKQDAYLGAVLKNRNMSGEFPILNSGNNTIAWTGSVTKVVVEPNSRWL